MSRGSPFPASRRCGRTLAAPRGSADLEEPWGIGQDVAAAAGADRISALLASSDGKPVIQIVLDPETCETTIRSVGVDQAAIPDFIVRLGRVLTGIR